MMFNKTESTKAMHVVDGPSQTIAPISDVLKIIDNKYDYLKGYYAGFAIQNVLPAFVGTHEEEFDTALIALIVLFVGCVTFVVVCCCLRHWVLPAQSELKKKEALIKKEIIDDLNTTENPLWIEHEPDGPSMTSLPNQSLERPDSADFVDNTYATIQHPARRSSDDLGNSATLSGALHHNSSARSSLRGTQRDVYPAAMGYQGSTFQVPDQNPGSSGLDALRSISALTINKDGQPEFVAELI